LFSKVKILFRVHAGFFHVEQVRRGASPSAASPSAASPSVTRRSRRTSRLRSRRPRLRASPRHRRRSRRRRQSPRLSRRRPPRNALPDSSIADQAHGIPSPRGEREMPRANKKEWLNAARGRASLRDHAPKSISRTRCSAQHHKRVHARLRALWCLRRARDTKCRAAPRRSKAPTTAADWRARAFCKRSAPCRR
jgi:hypothetical protein